ncbi:GroES-like protein [Fomitiporia mediterranea MF3/22]|uniref:GroES-like protein n=1 Tax=Fomitiporia mediterranea (strain MF3/22) TaxID=694068 RepID=UPI0004407498|nr:GroES-like protein [Fomitiporia mediterranea MF3/22]EJD05564.1 GroES-like protein [Fomitiporia mediterranea MF3/22]
MAMQKTFKGYAVCDAKKWSDFSVVDFPAKKWEETDVEIAITHCGVCGSDVHTLTSGWGALETPIIVGHEIAGTAVRVGSKVQDIKVGDRVGVGAQVASCYHCKYCKSDNEQYCPAGVDTYNSKHPDGVRTQGGYSTGIIAHEQFVFPLPPGVSNAEGCSMLCGGLTVFSPLVRNGAGPGKRVGIIGIGGLGHYAVMFAKALGARVYAFTHQRDKEKDIKKMGADHVVFTNPGFQEKCKMSLDLIVSTRDEASDYPLTEYLSMLDMHGKFISVGLPDAPLPATGAFAFAGNGCFFGGSHIGSKKEALAMLSLADKKGIKPWIEEFSMKDVKKAVEGVHKNNVRYRYVLKQDIA